MPPQHSDERTRLLRDGQPNGGHIQAQNGRQASSNKDGEDEDDAEVVEFDGDDDEEDPHN